MKRRISVFIWKSGDKEQRGTRLCYLVSIILMQLIGAFIGAEITNMVGMGVTFKEKYEKNAGSRFGAAALCPPDIKSLNDPEV